MLHLTSRTSELFLQQPAAEQRQLLQVVVEKAALSRTVRCGRDCSNRSRFCGIRTEKVL